jgi:hypothetical protein
MNFSIGCVFPFGVGGGGFSHPGAFFVYLFVVTHPFLVAGAIAIYHLVKFFPVDFPDIVMTTRFIPAQFRVGDAQPKEFRLWYSFINKSLS